jgi:hypothetical protein
MVHVNLVLWLAMVGAVFAPALHGAAAWIAIAGLVVAALWEHSAVRGSLKAKKNDALGVAAAE